MERLIRHFLLGLARLVSGCQVRWLGDGPEPGPRLYFANHSSHMDAVVLLAALPETLRERTRAVAGADYWGKGPLRRFISRVLGNVLIHRGPPQTPEEKAAGAGSVIAQLADHLDSGLSLIVFPEGTRSLDGQIQPFKSGIFHLSKARPELELLPVYLENLNRILPKGEFLPLPFLSSATFGRPLRWQPGESKAAFLARARQALLEMAPR